MSDQSQEWTHSPVYYDSPRWFYLFVDKQLVGVFKDGVAWPRWTLPVWMKKIVWRWRRWRKRNG